MSPRRPSSSLRYRRFRLSIVVLSILSTGTLGPVVADAESGAGVPPRFESEQPLFDGPADWISWGQDLAAFGSGRQLTLAAVRPDIELRTRLSLDEPVIDGVIAGSNLYLVQRLGAGQRLTVFDAHAIDTPPNVVPLRPEPGGPLQLTRMDDYLLAAEDGRGLRVLRLPGHRHHDGELHVHDSAPVQVGLFPLRERISAVTASLRWVYLAAETGLIVIDSSVPEAPRLVRRIPLDVDTEVRALAANGSRVYLLTEAGMYTFDASITGDFVVPASHPEVSGRAMTVLGRTVHVADGDAGVKVFRDQAAAAATFFVQVGDVFFNPPGVVNINIGDTVEWQKPPTVFPHNVFSCNAGQAGCGGADATELFVSGPVTTSPFNFSHTFTVAGSNPYVCQAHVFSMQGDIVVTGGPPPPPGVPDGSGLTQPMTVAKLDTSGTDLRLTFDTNCSGASGHDIVHGTGAQLPVVPGGTFALAGGRCGIGMTSPFDWTATPSPISGDFAWWLILADDGVSTEGSWGKDGTGQERNGPGANGSSGQCGNTDKDLSNTCGQ